MSDAKKIELADKVLALIQYETTAIINDDDIIADDEPTLLRIDRANDTSIMIFVDEKL